MTTVRKQLISLVDTSYSHCISRCVRRAFLCGEDKNTGKNFDHRRGWVEDQLLSLTQVFAIDVCAYAIMSNHNHMVLFIDEDTAKRWSTKEVFECWHQLFKSTLLTQNRMGSPIRKSRSIDEVKFFTFFSKAMLTSSVCCTSITLKFTIVGVTNIHQSPI